jgi:hypothetical protein
MELNYSYVTVNSVFKNSKVCEYQPHHCALNNIVTEQRWAYQTGPHESEDINNVV